MVATTTFPSPARFARTVFSWRFGLLVLPAILLLGLGLSCYQTLTRLSDDMAAVDQSQTALGLAEDLSSCLKDAESGQRGYLLTGKQSYLAPYEKAVKQFHSLHERLQRAEGQNQNQQLLRQIDEYSKDKMAELAETLHLRREVGLTAALNLVGTDQGERAMEQIRLLVTELRQVERQTLTRQTLSRHRNQIALIRLILGGGLALAGLLIFCGMVLTHDTGKRQVIEAALRESEDHYRHSVELNPQIPWTTNAQGQTLDVSAKLHASSGLKPTDGGSGGWIQHVHPEDQGRIAELWEKSLQTGEPLDCEHRQKLPDDRYHWMRTRAFPRRNERQQIVRWYGTSEDIQDRKAAEQALRVAKENLEITVEQRTMQLANSNRELELANKELETFAYTASHDLRSPLRNIDNLGLILAEDFTSELSEAAVNYIHRMRLASRRMGRLIDDLLAFSRLNQEEARPSVVNLSLIAARTFDELRTNDPSRRVETFVQPGVMAWGSPRLLGVVLNNLLGNAWKYTAPHEKAYIEFRFIQDKDDGSGTYIVKDNGVGFDMRHADLLFAPFQRLHRETEFPGTGIGLATAQRIIRRHGGDIWAESEVGKGSIFRFRLMPRPSEVKNGAKQATAAAG